MYEIHIDGLRVYRSTTFPPYPVHDICAAIAKKFGVTWSCTFNGEPYSY